MGLLNRNTGPKSMVPTIIILVQWVVVSSWCSGWLCHLTTTFWFLSSSCGVYFYLGDSDEQKYIQSETRNQIHSHQYVVELES